MLGVDLQQRTIQVFDQLAVAAAGSAVRAALGDGASSIMHAERLNAATLPGRPLLALRGGAMPGQSGEMRIPVWRWWVYDDPDRRYYRINGLIPLIEQAYPFYCMPFGKVAISGVSEEYPVDPSLGLLARVIALAFYTM